MKVQSITSFTGQYNFLSNFWHSPIIWEGFHYNNVEAAFQASKTLDINERAKIAAAPTASKAKSMGRKLELRPNWDVIKVGIMANLVREKFKIPELRIKLIDTMDYVLIEGNNWCDSIWGICNCSKCNYRGENMLGKILMYIRFEEYLEENAR